MDAQVADALADTQQALAAALARLQAARLREKQLTDELAQLRQEVHRSSGGGACPQIQTAGAEQPQANKERDLNTTSTCSITIPVVKEPEFTALGSEAPLYVCSTSGTDSAVAVWLPGDRGVEKVNCQLIMGKDWIDFVQLRVRVRAEDFIGITSVKDSKAKRLSELGDVDQSPEQPSASAGGIDDATGTMLARYRIYTRGRELQPVEFDASSVTRATLHKHTQRWLGQEDETGDVAIEAAVQQVGDTTIPTPRRGKSITARPPKHMVAGPPSMRLLGGPSQILSPQHVAALSSVIPPLERMRDWSLAYSTKLHGISLATLYRKVHVGQVPTVTVIKDNNGYVFGCYTPEGWRIAPRYYGSGETFVFQLEPYRLMWSWVSNSAEKNDFFQFSTPDCLALGGTGHFAFHIDQELLQGSSGICGTFGSPCLSAKEDFKVLCLEVWQVV